MASTPPRQSFGFPQKKNQFPIKKKYLLKPIFGSQGNDIEMIKKREDLKKKYLQIEMFFIFKNL